jgi:hypothetical protein
MAAPTKGERNTVATDPVIIPPETEAQHDGQREHKRTLKPAQIARSLPQNLTYKEHGQRTPQSDDPRGGQSRLF